MKENISTVKYIISLCYSRVEVAANARRLGSGFVVKKCSMQDVILFLIMRIKPDPGCGRPPRMGRNKADVFARREATVAIPCLCARA